MKRSLNAITLLSLLVLASCAQNEPEPVVQKKANFTGNEITYPLTSASTDYNVSGTATFKERVDNSSSITITLTGTNGDTPFPAHIHFGDLSVDKGSIAALLQSVDPKTGKSETILSKLIDESAITYGELKNLNGCIKVHLSSFGSGSSIILAAGNIGSAFKDNSGGRIKTGLCKSE